MAKEKKEPKLLPLEDFIDQIEAEGSLEYALFDYGLNPDEYDLPNPQGKRLKELVAQLRPLIKELKMLHDDLDAMAAPDVLGDGDEY